MIGKITIPITLLREVKITGRAMWTIHAKNQRDVKDKLPTNVYSCNC